MTRLTARGLVLALIVACAPAVAQVAPQVVNVPTRVGVTERFVYLAPKDAKAVVILFAGANGGVEIRGGTFKALSGQNHRVDQGELTPFRRLAASTLRRPECPTCS